MSLFSRVGWSRSFVLFVSVSIACPALANSDFGRVRGWWTWTLSLGTDAPQFETNHTVGYHPKQPIEFPHNIHAGDRQIPCEYCHSAARRSTVGGIPPMNTCMGCHKVVATDKDSIKYLTEKYEKNEPIVWTLVHDLPDYVRFSHQVHVNAKDAKGNPLLQCQTCHGKVEEMTTVKLVAPLLMGWCVECHEQKQTLADGSVSQHPQAPVTCNTCHY